MNNNSNKHILFQPTTIRDNLISSYLIITETGIIPNLRRASRSGILLGRGGSRVAGPPPQHLAHAVGHPNGGVGSILPAEGHVSFDSFIHGGFLLPSVHFISHCFRTQPAQPLPLEVGLHLLYVFLRALFFQPTALALHQFYVHFSITCVSAVSRRYIYKYICFLMSLLFMFFRVERIGKIEEVVGEEEGKADEFIVGKAAIIFSMF